MVRGLDTFKDFFRDFTDRYVLIGGVAATVAMEQGGGSFRATKDFDLVLVVEALDAEFGRRFWEFVAAGGYEIRERSDGSPVFYRFSKPADSSFPFMLELFSRSQDGIQLEERASLTPLPIDEGVSSLSAILLDGDYYQFVVTGQIAADGISWVGADRLIPLKASAWLDLSARREAGEQVDERNVKKHMNDVARLSQLIAPELRVTLPGNVMEQFREFLPRLRTSGISLKDLDMGHTTLDAVTDLLEAVFVAI
ncbi:hypothetical protein FBY21_2075 [Pseudomonas sp. SLBN-26]|uniref:hypothetical protein n=1 Tax=Pseudomonadaceae TaxID=135621 RepID=UPI001150C419|nr:MULTISPECIES: hypothetical protein [Pseudomonas]MCP1617467.1 hypothetical protein [Pseudomonas otitidis]TQL06707.1 hypothetical protein FBY21_2075 [Pseudomonas sp. SLBN-26]